MHRPHILLRRHLRRLCGASTSTSSELTFANGGLAAKQWLPPSIGGRAKVLCLHGWLDNAASFDRLAPHLAAALGATVVALDFHGHGASSHRPPHAGFGYSFEDHACAVVGVLRELGWSRDSHDVTVVGHSMGACVATLVGGLLESAAAAGKLDAASPASAPKRQRELEGAQALARHRARRYVLIEGLGPIARSGETAAATLSRHAMGRHGLLARAEAGERKAYPDLDAAIAARLKTIRSHPGSQRLSRAAAADIVRRGSTHAGDDAAPLRFRHDPTLLSTGAFYGTEEAALSYLSAMREVPVLLISAEDGWPYPEAALAKRRAALARLQTTLVAGGSHHCHADPETAPQVAEEISQFIVSQP